MKHVKPLSRGIPREAQTGPLGVIQILQILLPVILQVVIPLFQKKSAPPMDGEGDTMG